ncbi:MAG: poly(R)-hydroxyalkanoic acid synthase subunit PhaE [Bacteroidota bacterium]
MSSAAPPSEDPMDLTQLYQQGLKQWQQLMDQSAQAWGMDTSAFTAQTVRQAQAGQEAWVKSLAVAREALAELPGKLAAGEPVADLTQAFMARLQTAQAEQMEVLHRVLEDSGAAWQQFTDEVLQAAPLPAGWKAPESAARPFDAMHNVFDQALGRWLNTPALGLTREYNEEAAHAVHAFQRYKQAEVAYLGHIAGIWGQVFQNLGPAVQRAQQGGNGVDSLRGASRLWASVVDDTFGVAFRDPAYIDRQRAYLEAGLAVKKHRRLLQEVLLRALDLPTLTDLDDAGQYIHALRRQQRTLTKRLAAAEQRADAAEARAEAAEKQATGAEKQAQSARGYAREALAKLRTQVRAQGRTQDKQVQTIDQLQAQVAELTAQLQALRDAAAPPAID